MVKSNIDEKYELLQHLNRVSELAYKMAKHMKIEDSVCKEIAIAGHLHDIGKICINQDILNKTGKITVEEKSYLQEHVKYSYIMGLMMGERLTEDIVLMIYQHHENNDGTGYPNGVSGDETHIGSHIIRICDTYDAMRSNRPYRIGMSKESAFEEICTEKEKFNELCVLALMEIEEIEEKNINRQYNKINV